MVFTGITAGSVVDVTIQNCNLNKGAAAAFPGGSASEPRQKTHFSSWPGLSRPSRLWSQDVDARHKAGHDELTLGPISLAAF